MQPLDGLRQEGSKHTVPLMPMLPQPTVADGCVATRAQSFRSSSLAAAPRHDRAGGSTVPVRLPDLGVYLPFFALQKTYFPRVYTDRPSRCGLQRGGRAGQGGQHRHHETLNPQSNPTKST